MGASSNDAASPPLGNPLADLPPPIPGSSDPATAKDQAAAMAAGSDASPPEIPAPPGLPPIGNNTDANANANVNANASNDAVAPPPLAEIPAPPTAPQLPLTSMSAPAGLIPLPAPGGSSPAPGSALGGAKPTSLPAVNVASQKPKPTIKSWQTKLAPTAFVPNLHYNYRRDLLPTAIYTTRYAERNQHLPVQMTRQDYENLLFTSVLRNDVDTTRALLNAGTDMNIRAYNGETPLAAAQRVGAQATAQLLLARGAKL